MTNGKECLAKKSEHVRLVDANAVLVQACYWGYEKNTLRGVEGKSELQRTARCIVSSAERFYSFDATLKVLNECTKGVKNGAQIFNTYKYALYQNTRDEQRQRDDALSAQLQQPMLIPRFQITCFHHGDFSICN